MHSLSASKIAALITAFFSEALNRFNLALDALLLFTMFKHLMR